MNIYSRISEIDINSMLNDIFGTDDYLSKFPKDIKYGIDLDGKTFVVKSLISKRLKKFYDEALQTEYWKIDLISALQTMLTRDQVIEKIHKIDPNDHSEAADIAGPEFDADKVIYLTLEESKRRTAFLACVSAMLMNETIATEILKVAPKKKNGTLAKNRVTRIATSCIAYIPHESVSVYAKPTDDNTLCLYFDDHTRENLDSLEKINEDFISANAEAIGLTKYIPGVPFDPSKKWEIKAETTKKSAKPVAKAKASFEFDKKLFTINENGVLKKYKGESLEVVIPEGVTEIGEGAFKNSNIVSVTIPEGCKIIGEDAFYHCYSLKTVVFPDSIEKIGECAFYVCESLEEIHLGTKLKYLLYNAFYCENAKVFEIKSEKIRSINDSALVLNKVEKIIIYTSNFPLSSIFSAIKKCRQVWCRQDSDIDIRLKARVQKFKEYLNAPEESIREYGEEELANPIVVHYLD